MSDSNSKTVEGFVGVEPGVIHPLEAPPGHKINKLLVLYHRGQEPIECKSFTVRPGLNLFDLNLLSAGALRQGRKEVVEQGGFCALVREVNTNISDLAERYGQMFNPEGPTRDD